MKYTISRLLVAAAAVLACHFPVLSFSLDAKVVRVKDTPQLVAAIRAATPGTRIELEPGEYRGGLYFESLRGEKGRPIVIAAADPAKPPQVAGGGTGMHLVNPFYVELHDLHFRGATGNGLNIDHGGRYTPERRDLVLRRIRVADVGPRGNCDGIKLTGLTGFTVEDCTIERWGVGSGSGVDMVGCHEGLLKGNRFTHVQDAQATGGNAVQTKGGSSNVTIRQNRFDHAGQRAINIGGSTGLQFFAPPLDQWPKGVSKSEARNITVEGNTFIGSLAPLCFVGVDGAVVRYNTIYRPGRWAIRILQETNAPGFAPCSNGLVSDNLFVFHTSAWAQGGVNLGGNTAPETFRFERNHWFCMDRPNQSRPTLPTPEKDGIYGVDPQFEIDPSGELRLNPASPVKNVGAGAFVAK